MTNIIFKQGEKELKLNIANLRHTKNISNLESFFKDYTRYNIDDVICIEKLENTQCVVRLLRIIPSINRIFINITALKKDKMRIYLENQKQTIDLLAINNLLSLSGELCTTSLLNCLIMWLENNWIRVEEQDNI